MDAIQTSQPSSGWARVEHNLNNQQSWGFIHQFRLCVCQGQLARSTHQQDAARCGCRRISSHLVPVPLKLSEVSQDVGTLAPMGGRLSLAAGSVPETGNGRVLLLRRAEYLAEGARELPAGAILPTCTPCSPPCPVRAQFEAPSTYSKLNPSMCLEPQTHVCSFRYMYSVLASMD